jgi:ectoine hydroxylase-related dioxygenase (phytanoyl-CoA dioxygenase family)
MFTPNDLLDLKLQYDTQGFVHLKNLLPADVLSRARSAFAAAADRHALKVRSAIAKGERFFDLPDILDADTVFIDLVDLPRLLPLLRATIGEDLALNQTAARLFFPGPTFTSPFHSDIAEVAGINPAQCPNFLAKVHFYIEDLAPEQGCLSFIPGSQHLPPLHVNPHRPTLGAAAATRIVPRAGDAILFNTHVLHMAEPNNTANVRKSIIYTYGHFWMKSYASAKPADLDAFANDPQRQQLFGVEVPGTGLFARRLDRLVPPTPGERLRARCAKIMQRLLPAKTLPQQG